MNISFYVSDVCFLSRKENKSLTKKSSQRYDVIKARRRGNPTKGKCKWRKASPRGGLEGAVCCSASMVLTRSASMRWEQTAGTWWNDAIGGRVRAKIRFNRALRLFCHLAKPAVKLLDLFALLLLAYKAFFPDSHSGAKQTAHKRSNKKETHQETFHVAKIQNKVDRWKFKVESFAVSSYRRKFATANDSSCDICYTLLYY